MINEKLTTSFQLIFQKTSKLRVVPFSFDPKAKMWNVTTNTVGLAVSIFVQFCLYFLFFSANVLIFTYSLPPLLYYEANKVRENTVTSKWMLTRALANRFHRVSGTLDRKIIKSLIPLQIRGAGMHFLDIL